MRSSTQPRRIASNSSPAGDSNYVSARRHFNPIVASRLFSAAGLSSSLFDTQAKGTHALTLPGPWVPLDSSFYELPWVHYPCESSSARAHQLVFWVYGNEQCGPRPRARPFANTNRLLPSSGVHWLPVQLAATITASPRFRRSSSLPRLPVQIKRRANTIAGHILRQAMLVVSPRSPWPPKPEGALRKSGWAL